jgi:hypothetical protein
MDESEQEQEFKVTDKRRFTPEGESKEQKADREKEPTAEPPPTGGGAEQHAEKEEPKREEPPPPLDFTGFVVSLSHTALYQLGLIKIPGGEEPKKDLQGARQTIDLLALLEEKTKGNLTEQEARILTESLFQLRMAFVESSK